MRRQFSALILTTSLDGPALAQVTSPGSPMNESVTTWLVTASGEIRSLLGEVAFTIVVLSILATLSGLFLTSRERRIRHDAWSKRGETAAAKCKWDRASIFYRRAIRARPDDANTWFNLIQAELMAGNGHTAEELACQATRIPGMDPWDLLASRAAAAWLRGDNDSLHKHLHRLQDGAPEMAQLLAKILQVELRSPPEKS